VSLRPSQLRALRGIERDLADSEPDLDALFGSFATQGGRSKAPRAEKIGARPLWIFARLRRRRPLTERMKDWSAQNWTDP
jgi:hypothetical protein